MENVLDLVFDMDLEKSSGTANSITAQDPNRQSPSTLPKYFLAGYRFSRSSNSMILKGLPSGEVFT